MSAKVLKVTAAQKAQNSMRFGDPENDEDDLDDFDQTDIAAIVNFKNPKK